MATEADGDAESKGLTDVEARIQSEAIEFAKKNKKQIAKELTDPEIYPAEEHPVAVFMAGSPGAGKTEASLSLLADKELEGYRILRVDPDELRPRLPGYDGSNSWLLQGAVSILVEKVLDLAYDRDQSFILDGTFSHLEVARRNVLRALKKGRTVQILYVYLDPLSAWKFVQAREAREGRRIPPERFIEQYFAARRVVNTLKAELGSQIKVDLLQKPIDGSERIFHAGIDQIDYHIAEKYDPESLFELLHI